MRLKFIVIAIVALLFGYSGFWLYISQSAHVYIEKAAENLKGQGVVFTYDEYSVSGFPYKVIVTFENPAFHFKNGVLESTVQAKTMDAVAMPWNLKHVILFPENADIGVSVNGTEKRYLALSPETTAMSVHNDGTGHYRFSLDMKEVEIESNLDLEIPDHVMDLAFHLRKQDGPEVTTGLFEPKLLEMVFSGQKDEATSFLLSTSFLAESVPELTVPSLTEWRDMGGTFEIVSLEVHKAERAITGSGSFTLDPKLRPLGTFSVRGATYEDVLVFLETGRWITETEGNLVRNFMNLLELDAEDVKTVPLSFTFQDGYMSLGPVRLLEVGPVIRESTQDSPEPREQRAAGL